MFGLGTKLAILVLLIGLVMPTTVFAMHTDPVTGAAGKHFLGVDWGVAGSTFWDNTKNLVVNPRDQIGRAASIVGSGVAELLGELVTKALEGLSWVILQVAGFFLQITAAIMELAIVMTIQMDLSKLAVVTVGWTAVRDFANMFFIFALLYIAIQTILGLAGGGAKRWIAHLIIAAILINFSLFATTVVVDAGNILAVTFFNKSQATQGAGGKILSIKDQIIGGLGMQTTLASVNNGKGGTVTVTPVAQIIINVGGAIFMVIAGYVFLAAALMMVTRTIMLAVLMIFSPFAFMAFGLPKLEQYGHQWLDKLIKQTFVAPMFLFMLYLNLTVINGMNQAGSLLGPVQNMTWSSVFSGESSSYLLVFNYIILIGFFISSISVANGFAGGVGSHAQGWAKSATKWAGGMAAGGAVAGGAWGMRQTAGAYGQGKLKDEKWVQEQNRLVAKGGMAGRLANLKLAAAGGTARATFDPRATKFGQKVLTGGGHIDIGQAGGKGGFQATGSALGKVSLGAVGYTGTDRDKETLAIAEERYKNDPVAKEAYLKANLGTISARDESGKLKGETLGEKLKSYVVGEERYGKEGEFKTARQTIEREKVTAEAKKSLKDATKQFGDTLEEIKAGRMTEEDGKRAGEAAAEAIKKSLSVLNGKEAAELLDNKQLQMAPVIAALNNQHLSGLNTRTDLAPETIAAITNGVVTNGTDSARKYLRNQARIGSGTFQVDAEKELERLTKDYNTEKTAFESNPSPTPEKVEEWKKKAQELRGQSSRFLGMMETNEIAELDDALIAHEMVIEGYASNSKVQSKIRERLNSNLYSDTVAPVLQARFGKQTPPEPSRIVIPEGARTAGPVTPPTPQGPVTPPATNTPPTSEAPRIIVP
ncbi:MAG: hypothetical protein A3C93_04280 [Candidatus Lloydbacteria bacterium RIFCSPHIGHO2_02_FULL_54_17]|uniref:TraG N-terminal Proteobacteria domain-containing protein n=1 Tax=Candidatus Lloydbacteria bacterium RIFCSPHIGHO2_02_FULL_54_17 TaxID=1798664 RepID=A0A1G2DBV4_9BACT|nr:MAG: hypothetical protein A2762_03060 [Candidatus Lloydbacteria bacterium RIFCSPHIGHO2_01_FULL_54_11]OGZ11105.1 MAG: hypothetical protein A3C93_04280 [Candidatus Lloydbacteria bacterium RIFCSPHIGHO2_02_FULL_54_17]OGZ13025.1 MAG: hypothetical protein A2948_06155 [Candidatus Lloydbacteria bacterium RIFCSPLOWO2_01_FULL_54_18]